MFTDQIKIKFSAGKGGDGIISWKREKYLPKGGPYGGNGGNGGSIILESDPQIFSLDKFRNHRHISAKNGHQGGSHNKQGKNGKDLILKIPCGTIIRESESKALFYDFNMPNERLTICKGGKGGKGNTAFKSSTNRAPSKCTPGRPGEVKELELELKLIADVGFVGFPNAGKSTILSKISSVKLKTGPYPFTTLKPNLSFIEYDDFSRVYMADIPGIIRDAHLNKGLGLSFLKHIERSSVLVYVIDISGEEGRDPYKDFETLRHEIESYSPLILKKPFLVALNKIDKQTSWLAKFQEKYLFPKDTLIEISALRGKGLDTLTQGMRTLAQKKEKKFN